MKYVTHLTVAAEDDKHEDLRERMGGGVSGLAAYGAYWMVLEKIGAQIRPESVSTSMTKTVSKWSEIAGVKTSWFRKWSRAAHEAGLIRLSENGNKVTIGVPNILKYCDEYSRKLGIKSGRPPDKLRSDSGTPALPALPDKQDLKTGACGIVDNSPKNAGAKPADGGVPEAPPPPAPTGGNTHLPIEIKNLNLRDDVAKKIAALFLEYQTHPIHNNALADALLAAGLTSGEIVKTAQAFLGSVGKGL